MALTEASVRYASLSYIVVPPLGQADMSQEDVFCLSKAPQATSCIVVHPVTKTY